MGVCTLIPVFAQYPHGADPVRAKGDFDGKGTGNRQFGLLLCIWGMSGGKYSSREAIFCGWSSGGEMIDYKGLSRVFRIVLIFKDYSQGVPNHSQALAHLPLRNSELGSKILLLPPLKERKGS